MCPFLRRGLSLNPCQKEPPPPHRSPLFPPTQLPLQRTEVPQNPLFSSPVRLMEPFPCRGVLFGPNPLFFCKKKAKLPPGRSPPPLSPHAHLRFTGSPPPLSPPPRHVPSSFRKNYEERSLFPPGLTLFLFLNLYS